MILLVAQKFTSHGGPPGVKGHLVIFAHGLWFNTHAMELFMLFNRMLFEIVNSG